MSAPGEGSGIKRAIRSERPLDRAPHKAAIGIHFAGAIHAVGNAFHGGKPKSDTALFRAKAGHLQHIGGPGGIGAGAEFVPIAHAVAVEIIIGKHLGKTCETPLRSDGNLLAKGVGEAIADGVAARTEIEAFRIAGASNGRNGADGIKRAFAVLGIGQGEGDGGAGFQRVITIGRAVAVERNFGDVVASGHARAPDGRTGNDGVTGTHDQGCLLIRNDGESQLGGDLSVIIKGRLRSSDAAK